MLLGLRGGINYKHDVNLCVRHHVFSPLLNHADKWLLRDSSIKHTLKIYLDKLGGTATFRACAPVCLEFFRAAGAARVSARPGDRERRHLVLETHGARVRGRTFAFSTIGESETPVP
jgi:hypothetical protein